MTNEKAFLSPQLKCSAGVSTRSITSLDGFKYAFAFFSPSGANSNSYGKPAKARNSFISSF